MMGSLLRIVFFTLLTLTVAWGMVLSQAGRARTAAEADERRMRAAFPQMPPHWHLEGAASSLPLEVGYLPGDPVDWRGAFSILKRRAGIALGLLPLFGVSFVVAILGGALLRERLRGGTAYASPTSSFLAKRLAEGVLVAVFVWVFSPVSWSYGMLYLLISLFMVGVTGYVANLPLRL